LTDCVLAGAPIRTASLVPSTVKVTAAFVLTTPSFTPQVTVPRSSEERLLADAREGLVSPLVVKKYQSLTTGGVRLKKLERMAKVPR